jgi:hypothetical protein
MSTRETLDTAEVARMSERTLIAHATTGCVILR